MKTIFVKLINSQPPPVSHSSFFINTFNYVAVVTVQANEFQFLIALNAGELLNILRWKFMGGFFFPCP